jgi:hypothetical protein
MVVAVVVSAAVRRTAHALPRGAPAAAGPVAGGLCVGLPGRGPGRLAGTALCCKPWLSCLLLLLAAIALPRAAAPARGRGSALLVLGQVHIMHREGPHAHVVVCGRGRRPQWGSVSCCMMPQ